MNPLLTDLKTTPTAQVQAHLDRLKDSELFFARIMAGEVLAGRQTAAFILGGHITALRKTREALADHHNSVNGL